MPGSLGTAVTVAGGVIGLYALLNLFRSRNAGELDDVAEETTRRTFAGLGAVVTGAATMVLVVGQESVDLIAQLVELAAMFPDAIGYGGMLALGAGAAGPVPISAGQFVLVAAVFLVIVAAMRR